MENLDQKIGKYTLVYKIGDGGMAEVFKARVRREEGFEKEVALKKILPNLASNEKFRRNFINEAQICGQLHHHNIVEVYDFAQEGNDLYLAMEFIDGLNLEEVFNYHRQVEQPMTTDVILAIMTQVLEGLEYAHHAKDPISKQPLNVVHRDLKPSNILIDNAGVVKIVDFGVAKAANRRYETQEMTAKGTASYMAPEQLLGDRPVAASADIFSIGSIFYELLTLNRLFDGEHVFAILKEVATMDIDAFLDQTITGADRKFLPILRRGLAREPEQRYKRSGDMLRDLLGMHIPGATPRRLADHLRKIRNLAENMEDAATRLMNTNEPSTAFEDEGDEDEQETRVVGNRDLDPMLTMDRATPDETTERPTPRATKQPAVIPSPAIKLPDAPPPVPAPARAAPTSAMPSIVPPEVTSPIRPAPPVSASPSTMPSIVPPEVTSPVRPIPPVAAPSPMPSILPPPNPPVSAVPELAHPAPSSHPALAITELNPERMSTVPTRQNPPAFKIAPLQDSPSVFGPIAIGASIGLIILAVAAFIFRS